jgi:hypothetical protein
VQLIVFAADLRAPSCDIIDFGRASCKYYWSKISVFRGGESGGQATSELIWANSQAEIVDLLNI